MIENNGYILNYKPKENQIVITLPQTISTLTNTVTSVENRRVNITHEEQALILSIIKAIMEAKEE